MMLNQEQHSLTLTWAEVRDNTAWNAELGMQVTGPEYSLYPGSIVPYTTRHSMAEESRLLKIRITPFQEQCLRAFYAHNDWEWEETEDEQNESGESMD